MNEATSSIHTVLHHLSAVYARGSDQILQEQFGIGFSQYKILSSLAENPALRQKHIAFELGQTEASISRQVKLLLRKGMLGVRRNPANLREHQVELTPKGERILDAAQGVLELHQSADLHLLSAKQQAQLLELLAKIYV